ncbi:hypothetical protein U9M48_012554 [Paspalum notatum var. saurae]|uniref:Uncharacterized protein n=1 Tax=Paspalum notatum var. saurae TaxID=547442 RepID=A0AAQ3WIN0_PASNO
MVLAEMCARINEGIHNLNEKCTNVMTKPVKDVGYIKWMANLNTIYPFHFPDPDQTAFLLRDLPPSPATPRSPAPTKYWCCSSPSAVSSVFNEARRGQQGAGGALLSASMLTSPLAHAVLTAELCSDTPPALWRETSECGSAWEARRPAKRSYGRLQGDGQQGTGGAFMEAAAAHGLRPPGSSGADGLIDISKREW